MTVKTLFTNADILLRRSGAYETLKGAFLGVDGDTICYIGSERPQEKYDTEKNMTGKLLMPGLINCHSHIAMTLMRGVGSGLPLQKWLFDTLFPIEDRLTPELITPAARYAMLELIAGGTTSFSDMYFFPWETLSAVRESGLRANLCRSVDCFDREQNAEDYFKVKQSIEMFEAYHGAENDRIRIDFSLHAEYTNTEKIAAPYSRMCAERGGRMHIHLAETEKEQRECIERYGMTPTKWFEAMGTLDSPTAAAHCVAVTDEDLYILKECGVSVVHNPTSNMKLGSGFAPVRRMLDMGINVALGTDGAASNDNLNMFEEMHLASVIHCGYHNDPTHLKASEVLDMATVNGAKAQGRDDVGVLEVGKKADVIALDMTKPHLYPCFDIAALLTCSAQAGDVCMTMVDGRILYENGVYLTLDEEKVRAEMADALAKLYNK